MTTRTAAAAATVLAGLAAGPAYADGANANITMLLLQSHRAISVDGFPSIQACIDGANRLIAFRDQYKTEIYFPDSGYCVDPNNLSQSAFFVWDDKSNKYINAAR